jgi:hypothetical protein
MASKRVAAIRIRNAGNRRTVMEQRKFVWY